MEGYQITEADIGRCFKRDVGEGNLVVIVLKIRRRGEAGRPDMEVIEVRSGSVHSGGHWLARQSGESFWAPIQGYSKAIILNNGETVLLGNMKYTKQSGVWYASKI